MTIDDFIPALWVQNPRLHTDLTEQTYEGGILSYHSFQSQPPGAVHWILEVTAEVRNAARKAPSLYLGCNRCRTLDYVNIEQVLKTTNYGF